MVKSLWPAITDLPTLRAPVVILREQASALAEMTRNRLTARVTTHQSEFAERLKHFFIVEAPGLGGYTYNLLQVEHPIMPYPCVVTFEAKPEKAENEQDFEKALAKIFQSSQVRGIIAALLAQSSDEREF